MGKSLSPRVRKEIIEFTVSPDGETVSAFCRRLGISRKSFYRIRDRAAAEGGAALAARSRAPITPARRYDEEVHDTIARARAELEAEGYEDGPLSIWWWLQRQGYTRIPSTATIARSLRRQGLSTPTPNKRPKDSYKRFQKDFANEMWQLDGIEHYIGDRMCTIYQIVDDRTRLMVALNARWGGESIAGAKAAFTQAFRRYGMPAIVLTDNGGAFNSHRRGWLNGTEKWLADNGIRPISGSVLHPRTQGKVERAHQPVQKRLAKLDPASTIDELNIQLEHYRDFYNNDRQHQGLGLSMTPARVWAHCDKVTNLPQAIPYEDLLAFPTTLEEPEPEHQDITAERLVERGGRISWGDRPIYVGIRNAGRTVHLLQKKDQLLLAFEDGIIFGDIPWPHPVIKSRHINVTRPPHYILDPPTTKPPDQ